jgi:hypothetical protein
MKLLIMQLSPTTLLFHPPRIHTFGFSDNPKIQAQFPRAATLLPDSTENSRYQN